MASKLAQKSFILISFFLFSLNFVTSIDHELETLAPDVLKDVKAGMTHIHFFFHDIVSGNNPTVRTITPAASGSTTTFGKTSIIDDKLTEGPDISSKEVGRAQGLYAGSSLTELGLLQAIDELGFYRRCIQRQCDNRIGAKHTIEQSNRDVGGWWHRAV